MGIRAYKPRTPGRRGMTAVTTEELSKKRPEKSLTSFRRSTGARNNDGRTTVRFRGGGHKRLYRKIDFRRDKTRILGRSEEHTSELQSLAYLVCRLLLEKKTNDTHNL